MNSTTPILDNIALLFDDARQRYFFLIMASDNKLPPLRRPRAGVLSLRSSLYSLGGVRINFSYPRIQAGNYRVREYSLVNAIKVREYPLSCPFRILRPILKRKRYRIQWRRVSGDLHEMLFFYIGIRNSKQSYFIYTLNKTKIIMFNPRSDVS